ncbi:MAG: carboxylating nicotinate-nucleotide diphosphorylase [Alphaproteobacteria bacterium]|nr:carboxylating nicotinate-nucleotide diphosphorylase [Alphaproteobacteria bacterium]
MPWVESLPDLLLRPMVEAALREDLGDAGDITSALLPPDLTTTADIVSREAGICCGLDLARLSFAAFDPKTQFTPLCRDGEQIVAGSSLAQVSGKAVALLTAERVALNFMSHLSGIATATAQMNEAIRSTPNGEGVRLTCTRKTLPGLRLVEKYALRCGGGFNHRFGLYDAVLLKDNHLAMLHSPAQAVARARQRVGHLVKIEIEVDDLSQLAEILKGEFLPDAVLLDNMSIDQLLQAVAMRNGAGCLNLILEASGGVSLTTVAEIAATGIDVISAGSLTHSSRALDIGLDFTRGERCGV